MNGAKLLNVMVETTAAADVTPIYSYHEEDGAQLEELLERLIATADINGDGRVTAAEASVLVALSSDEPPAPIQGEGPFGHEEARALLRPYGWDEAVLIRNVERLEGIARIFRRLDGDKSGSLGLPELSAALRASSEEECGGGNQGDLAGLMATLDADGSGRVSWFEFFSGLSAEGFTDRFASFDENAIANAPMNIFSDGAHDRAAAKDAMDSLNILEKLPCKFLEYRAKRELKRPRRAKVGAQTDDAADVSVTHLTKKQLDKIDSAIFYAMGAGITAGIGSALLIKVASAFSPTGDPMMMQLFLLSASLFISGIEVLLIYWVCIETACEMARVCDLRLWPLDHERALLTAALARAALELPHPLTPALGVDPMKRLNGLKLRVAQVVYAGRRGLTVFLFKLLIKKVVTRVMLRSAIQGQDLDLVLMIVVNVIWNALMVACCVRNAKICVYGPSAATHAVHDCIRRHERTVGPLSLDAKELLLRAVGVSVVQGLNFHPNHYFALCYLERLLVDDRLLEHARTVRPGPSASAAPARKTRIQAALVKADQLVRHSYHVLGIPTEEPLWKKEHRRLECLEVDDPAHFRRKLREAKHGNADLGLEMLAVSLCLDGRCDRRNCREMEAALNLAGRTVPFPVLKEALAHCCRSFTSGMGFCPRDLVRAAGSSEPAGAVDCAPHTARRSDVALSYLAVDYCC